MFGITAVSRYKSFTPPKRSTEHHFDRSSNTALPNRTALIAGSFAQTNVTMPEHEKRNELYTMIERKVTGRYGGRGRASCFSPGGMRQRCFGPKGRSGESRRRAGRSAMVEPEDRSGSQGRAGEQARVSGSSRRIGQGVRVEPAEGRSGCPGRRDYSFVSDQSFTQRGTHWQTPWKHRYTNPQCQPAPHLSRTWTSDRFEPSGHVSHTLLSMASPAADIPETSKEMVKPWFWWLCTLQFFTD